MKATQPTTDRQPAIIRSESMALITDSLPQTHKTNTGSADRCNRAINELIRDIEANGMNDELDRKAAIYIARTNTTVRQMAERRAPYTKLFDQIRSEFTKLEKSIEPGIQGTPPTASSSSATATHAKSTNANCAHARPRRNASPWKRHAPDTAPKPKKQ